MNTETKTLRIRRATVLDAVNIFRLIVDEEKRSNTRAVFDDATRLHDTIAAIETGYVSVAVISGRTVGSIGALLADEVPNRRVLIGTFFVLSPSFRDTQLGNALLNGLLREATKNRLPVKFALPSGAPLTEVLSDNGFDAKLITWGWEPSDKTNEELGTDNSGRDAIAGDTGTDEVDADPDDSAARSAA